MSPSSQFVRAARITADQFVSAWGWCPSSIAAVPFFRSWHKADMPIALSDVCFRR
jgi:hypothetical protein